MRRYETIVILDPDISDEDRGAALERIREVVAQQEGFLVKEDLWGTKKLAYEIKKKPRGYYVRFDYCGMGTLVSELERFFRIDDRFMKYLTVQLESDADVEKIQADMAAAEQPAAAGQAEETAVTNDEPAASDDSEKQTAEADADAQTTKE